MTHFSFKKWVKTIWQIMQPSTPHSKTHDQFIYHHHLHASHNSAHGWTIRKVRTAPHRSVFIHHSVKLLLSCRVTTYHHRVILERVKAEQTLPRSPADKRQWAENSTWCSPACLYSRHTAGYLSSTGPQRAVLPENSAGDDPPASKQQQQPMSWQMSPGAR